MQIHSSERVARRRPAGQSYWFTRYAKSIIFLILILVGRRASTWRSPFRSRFSRRPTFRACMIGVDNGVMPIDQMMVTITRPIEEAVNSVPGLQQVRSITSRGSAEIDLFFDWNVDMVTDAATGRCGAVATFSTSLPPTATIRNAPPDLCQLSHHRLQPDLRHRAADAAVGHGDLRSQAAAEPARRRRHRAGARRAGAGVPHHARSREAAGGQRHRHRTSSTRCGAPT